MIYGYKNREVRSDKTVSSLDALSANDRIEYLREHTLTSRCDIDSSREVGERQCGRDVSFKWGIEDVVHGYFHVFETDIDGCPLAFFLNFDYGVVKVIRFSDNTLLVTCSEEKFNVELYKTMLKDGRCAELLDNFIRVDLKKECSLEENFIKINQI